MNEVFGNNISIILTWGIEWGRCARALDQEELDTAFWNSQRISATGDTFRDVPITRSKSTLKRSSARELSKSSVNFSPKKVISGFNNTRVSAGPHIQQGDKTEKQYLHYARRILRSIAFILNIAIPLSFSFLLTFLAFRFDWSRWERVANFAKWHFATENVGFDICTRHPLAAL